MEKIRKKLVSELLEFSIINLDKPSGPTSFDLDTTIKKALNLRKTSHFGTLDPKVTGVLPIALNRACRLSEFFMHKNKVYVGEMYLHSEISLEKLKQEMQEFTGKIMQKPPVKSRVKREFRQREIKKFEILELDGKKVKFLADVQAGTYIRKLISDLGEKIGGAHMTKLRRIKAGIFEEKHENFITLEELEKAIRLWKENNDETKLREILIPAEEAIKKVMQIIQVKEKALKQLLTGKPIFAEDIEEIPDSEHFAVFFKDRFIGVYRKTAGLLSENNETSRIVGKAEFVFN